MLAGTGAVMITSAGSLVSIVIWTFCPLGAPLEPAPPAPACSVAAAPGEESQWAPPPPPLMPPAPPPLIGVPEINTNAPLPPAPDVPASAGWPSTAPVFWQYDVTVA